MDVRAQHCPAPSTVMRFDAKTDGRGAVRSTGLSSCGNMRYGLEEGATSSGATPLRYGDVEEYTGGPRICDLGVVQTVSTLAPTRMPRDGVDAGSNSERSRWIGTVWLKSPVGTRWRLLQGLEKEWVAPRRRAVLLRLRQVRTLALILYRQPQCDTVVTVPRVFFTAKVRDVFDPETLQVIPRRRIAQAPVRHPSHSRCRDYLLHHCRQTISRATFAEYPPQGRIVWRVRLRGHLQGHLVRKSSSGLCLLELIRGPSYQALLRRW
jgi:hypothetical protein